MKRQKILYLICCVTLVLSACSANPPSPKIVFDSIAPESELIIASSSEQVPDFLAQNAGYTTGYEADECYNITPAFIADNSDYAVFKYNNSTESFIMYESNIYSIGTCFGGYGITSMALADLNKDGAYELYYTFSWGSGRHCSQVGYFDPVSKEVHIFENHILLDSDMMLTTNASGDLCVNSASLAIDDFVNFTIRAQDFMGTINWKENQITLNISEPN